MNSKRRTWLQATVATAGAAALALGGAAMPAFATESSPEAVTLETDKYVLAAAQINTSADEVKSLENMGTLGVSDHGFVYYIDEARADIPATPLTTTSVAAAAIPGAPAEGSRPGAPVTVYLDFDGEILEDTAWNVEAETATLNFAATAGATAEFQEQVWASVAEDYAPFNVNVTTTRPSDEALYKRSADDSAYGAHVIITDSYDEVLPDAAGTGGLAFVGGAGSDYLSGALVFTQGTGGSGTPNAKGVAEAATHEAGHNFGLAHDGIATTEYYGPSDGLWAPIMGVSYEVPISQWSAGDYAGASNTEDDLSVITDRGAAKATLISITLPDGSVYTKNQVCIGSGDPQNPQPGDVFYAVNDDDTCGDLLTLNFTYTDRADFAADEIGNDPANASTLDNSDDTFTASSVIETSTDVDVFKLTTDGGPFTATVDVAEINPNLDAKLTLLDEDGAELASDNPDAAVVNPAVAEGLGAELSQDLEEGTYFLAVEGVGFGDPTMATVTNANGYVAYGSLGNYTLSGTAAEFVAPLAAPAVTAPTDGSSTKDTTPAITGTGVAGAQVEVTLTGDDDLVITLTSTVGEDGNWSVALDSALAEGDYSVTATQTLEDETSAASAAVAFTVAIPLDVPAVQTPADGTTTEDTTPIFTGTGIAGAEVTVTVTAADGSVVTLTGTVGTDGTWSVTVPSALADGVYTVSASQAFEGKTSAPSVPVSFTVAAVPAANANADAGGAAGGSADAAAGADAGASATSAADGNSDGNLANTGSDFSFAPIAYFTVALLIAGGIVAAVGVRQRRRFAEEV